MKKIKLTVPAHSKTSKKKRPIKPFSFQKGKNKKSDEFEGITLGIDIVNMGILGSKLCMNVDRKFTTGIYFKQNYVFYTNGHFLVYRKLLKTDIEDIKQVDGQLWNFTHHRKPKANMSVPYVFYKVRKTDKNNSEAVSDYGVVKISNDVIYPSVPFPNIDEKNLLKNYIATSISPYYLQTITSMMGSNSHSEILIDKRYNKGALLVTSENAGALLMPLRTDLKSQIEKYNQLKYEVEEAYKIKETKCN